MASDFPRVVITGCGVVSALGFDRATLFERLLAGESAIRVMPEWELPGATGELLAAPLELPHEKILSLDRKLRRSMAPVAIYATLATRDAIAESGLSDEELTNGTTGCAIGSTLGSPSAIHETMRLFHDSGLENMPAQQFFKSVSHTAAFNVANVFGLTGALLAPCSACASGLQAIGVAYDEIRLGRQTVMLAGGTDEATPEVAGTFEQLFALAHPATGQNAAEAIRPFDVNRSGLAVGEGAAVLVLEERVHALRRGARILAEICGYATNASGRQTSQSDAEAIERCLTAALREASLQPANIHYISAHATGTRQGDAAEAAALTRIFGNAVPVSSLKAQLGHTMGASGALELAVTLEMARRNTLLPTANLAAPDEACAGLDLLQAPRHSALRYFVKDCFAFGGINAVLIGEMPSAVEL
ncbi:MAG: beta-ketoacyl-ACP synthase [Victivallales bacterium]|nr:beta-ketoacyl-ACP synthase [Victivallales bacterium]